jgi:ubiquinone/menaquinone biosynthesis C-methylase UbiE
VPIDYLMESAGEAARLEAKTDARLTRKLLRLTRLRQGQDSLDAGAGTGAIARVMAQMVGASGTVVALDGSPDRLLQGRRLVQEGGVAFVAGDLRKPPLKEGSFDYVWCRFVFEYLDNPDLVFDELLRLVKPGGKLVVGDLDGNGLFHYPFPPDLAVVLKRLEDGLRGRFDPTAGRKIYRLFWERRLSAIRVHLFPYNLYAGAASAPALDNWRQKFDTLRRAGHSILGEAEYEDFACRFLDFLAQEGTLSYSVLFMVEGVRT